MYQNQEVDQKPSYSATEKRNHCHSFIATKLFVNHSTVQFNHMTLPLHFQQKPLHVLLHFAWCTVTVRQRLSAPLNLSLSNDVGLDASKTSSFDMELRLSVKLEAQISSLLVFDRKPWWWSILGYVTLFIFFYLTFFLNCEFIDPFCTHTT